jgi:hypothetical protein
VAITVVFCTIGVALWGFCLGLWYASSRLGAAQQVAVPLPSAAARPSQSEYTTPPPMKIPAAFPQAVKFQIGETQFLSGDSIKITEVNGVSDTMATGNAYQIRGVYTLASHSQATMSIYVTSDAKEHDPVDEHQSLAVTKGAGAFTLILPFYCRGAPHVSFYADGGSFGETYFGSGEYLYQ